MGDYRGVQPAPTQQHIDAFITAVTQPGGPMQAAFDYLRQNGLLPPGEGVGRVEIIWYPRELWGDQLSP